MKKVILIFLLITSMAFAADLEEGIHYKTLDWSEEKGKVTEVFSVFCSFCYKYEQSVIPALKKALPEGVIFEEIHLKEMGKYGAVANNVLAVSLSQSSEQFNNAKIAYFDFVYGMRKNIKNEEQALKIGLEAAKISKEQYTKLLESEDVQNILNNWSRAIDAAVLQGTPSIIVNNKYLVLVSSIKSQEDFNKIVNELLKM